MKINWTYLAMTPGYKSLKAAYIHDVKDAAKQKNAMRTKAEFLQKFYWVLNRAKHYSIYTDKPVYQILNEWEDKRSYWWLNYYQDCNQPKFHSNSKKSVGLSGIKKYYKENPFGDFTRAKRRVNEFIKDKQAKTSKRQKGKSRWCLEAKMRRKRAHNRSL